MKIPSILYLVLSVLSPLCALARGPQINEEYARDLFVDSSGRSMPYRMLSPQDVESGRKYPLVLFLHGAGERGDDNEKQLAHGASVFSNPANSQKYPAFVVFPQCKEKYWTGNVDERSFMPGAPVPEESVSEKTLMELVGNLIENYPVDRDRVYVVGISMGGIAAYDLVCRYPEVFTAAIPICGAVNPDRLADARDVSFLIFHGEEDDEIPSLCSREAYKALNSAGADVDYIEFAGAGHDCWSSAFNYPAFLPWLFSQSRGSVGRPTGESLTCTKE